MELHDQTTRGPPPHPPSKMAFLFQEVTRRGVLAAVSGLQQPNQAQLLPEQESKKKRKEEDKNIEEQMKAYRKVPHQNFAHLIYAL